MISRRASVLRLLTIVIAALGIGCRSGPQAVEKTLLASLPTSYVEKSLVLSDDGKAFAFVTKADEGQRVVSSHGTSELHAECGKIAFAPKSHRLFYWTREGPRDQPVIAMVADGKTIATDFVGFGEFVFSEDGTHWIGAGAARGPEEGQLGDITLFVDGEAMARGRDMAMPSFSRDGRRVAYLSATDRRVSLAVDGRVRQTFEPPTAECGAAALRVAPEPDLPLRHVVKFLPDDTVLVITRDPDGWGVYIDGRRVASYPRSGFDHADGDCVKAATFVPRSLRVAEAAPAAFWWERVAGDAELWRVVRNGHRVDDITCIEPWRRHPPEPSSDGAHVVYACATAGPGDTQVVFIVKDGMRYGAYDNVWGMAPTTDGAHVAYGAARGADELPWGLYVDGQLRVDGMRSVWRPRLSEDGATLAWEGTLTDAGRGLFGIDGHRLGTFDEVLWGPEFLPDDRVGWVVRRGRKLTRITVPIGILDEPRYSRAPRAVLVHPVPSPTKH